MATAATFDVEYVQYLDPEGKPLVKELPEVAKDAKRLVELYKQMAFVRVFDGKSVNLQRTGKLGTYASCLGHEAAHVAMGAVSLRPQPRAGPGRVSGLGHTP